MPEDAVMIQGQGDSRQKHSQSMNQNSQYGIEQDSIDVDAMMTEATESSFVNDKNGASDRLLGFSQSVKDADTQNLLIDPTLRERASSVQSDDIQSNSNLTNSQRVSSKEGSRMNTHLAPIFERSFEQSEFPSSMGRISAKGEPLYLGNFGGSRSEER